MLSVANTGVIASMASPMSYGFRTWHTLYNVGPATSGSGPGTDNVEFNAILLPFSCVVKRMWWANGSSSSGTNVSAAIYAPKSITGEPGGLIVQTAATAQGTVSQVQFVDVTDTYLPAGPYWLALATAGTTSFFGWTDTSWIDAYSTYTQASITVGSLPSTATPTEPSGRRTWLFGFSTTTIT